jgi:D-aminoacyl-tRNA deacylase
LVLYYKDDVSILNSYYTFVASKKDPASITMADYLIGNKGFSIKCKNYGDDNSNSFESEAIENVRLHVSNTSLLFYLEDLDEIYPNSTAFIFLSKHSSESRIPTLTCHFTGNYTDDIHYGGNPRELGISYPYFQKQYIKEINNMRSLVSDYDIVIEATHHGPTSLRKPVTFIEIGSTERQWVDKYVASVVCDCILTVITSGTGHCKKVGIGLGGTHYPVKFTRLLLESEFGLGAVAAKHDLMSINEDMINQMISKSVERVTHIVIDRKGLGKEKKRIIDLIKNKSFDVLEI